MSTEDFNPEASVAYYDGWSDKELPFNKYRLDEEFITQPELYKKWAKFYGQSLAARKQVDKEVERARSELSLKIKASPEIYGLDKKSTETSVKDVINGNEKVREKEDHANKVYALSHVLEGIMKSFEQRKELLKGEGELWKGGYYSSVAPVLSEELASREKARDDLRKETRGSRSSRTKKLDL